MNNARQRLTVRRITTPTMPLLPVIRQVSAEYGLPPIKVIPLPTPIWMNCDQVYSQPGAPTGW